ncbi:G5 domain-containing protein [Actinoplanes sp. NPDC049118]|uniref:G5 domain-containing protein n=1 Tax=Actinoplanes sp. NPDC049118 TaxID=3155769 RepID=UPI0034060E8F
MATAGLGALVVVAGSAAGIAALTSTDTRVVNAVGSDSSVVELPPPDASELGAEDAAGQDGGGQGPAGRSGGDQSAGLPNTGRAGAEPADDGRSGPAEADRTATRTPRRTTPVGGGNSAGAAASPAGGSVRVAGPAGLVVRVERVSESESIPFRTRLIRDPSLPPGSRRIQTPGIPGERVLHYEVTFTGSKETGRRLIDSTVTREPQHRVVAFGNRRGNGLGGGLPHRRECQLGLGPCIGLGRGTACIDGNGDRRQEDLIDGDLSLLTPVDIDELQLTLPCEAEPRDAGKDAAKDVSKNAAKDAAQDPATVATPGAGEDDRQPDGEQG